MSRSEAKKQLRNYYLSKMNQLPAAERSRISARITEVLLSSPAWAVADTVFCYAGTLHELDTSMILKAALDQGKKLVLPRVEGKTSMTARCIRDLSELVPGPMGLSEPPESAPIVPADAISLILVPGLAFDRLGYRLGHGGGYYDRYLTEVSCPCIGLCPEENLADALPHEPHDVRVSQILTEKALYSVDA